MINSMGKMTDVDVLMKYMTIGTRNDAMNEIVLIRKTTTKERDAGMNGN